MTVCTSIHDMIITSKLFFKKCYEMLTNSWDKLYGLNTAFKFMNIKNLLAVILAAAMLHIHTHTKCFPVKNFISQQ